MREGGEGGEGRGGQEGGILAAAGAWGRGVSEGGRGGEDEERGESEVKERVEAKYIRLG